MADIMSIDKRDPTKDDTDESMGSSPDADRTAPNNGNNPGSSSNNPASTGTACNAPETQAPKRKGGRKPIYATSEERIFRRRNSKLTRQLRIGIDVQAELRAKTGSPNLGPTHVPQNLVQPPPIQRAMLNRHHQSRRSTSSIAPKLEPGVSLPPPLHTPSSASPKNRPTPSSHSNSPTTTAPGFGSQTGASPAGSDPASIRTTMSMKPLTTMAPVGRPMAPAFRLSGPAAPNPYYATPSFQNHIEQLEQEYDAQPDMIDDPEADTPGPGPYPAAFGADPQAMAVSPTTTSPPGQQLPPIDSVHTQSHHGQYPSMTQLLDPSLDWDPFGLSASMQFPTQFSFDTSNMR